MTKKSLSDRSRISVIIALYNCREHIGALLDSLEAQTIMNIEIIISDDLSVDGSLEIVEKYAQRDSRYVVLRSERNCGPAAARNRALKIARGEWIAIVDADDILHPARFEILLQEAERLGADVISDNLLFFDLESGKSRIFLDAKHAVSRKINFDEYIENNDFGSSGPAFGYLKPLFRRAAFENLSYDERLRIGEDFDLMARALFSGFDLWIIPYPFYLYRRHKNSISHRLSTEAVSNLISAHESFMLKHGPFTGRTQVALKRRSKKMKRALKFECFVKKIKNRRLFDAFLSLIVAPSLALGLLQSVYERMTKTVTKNFSPANKLSIVIFPFYFDPSKLQKIMKDLDIEGEIVLYRLSDVGGGMPHDVASEDIVKLSSIGVRYDVTLVCIGTTAIFAAGFLPRKNIFMTMDNF